ncbi:MAG: hypothetical protein O9972_44885, partial [Burkholderiales bacterium]|nr:hypothetical protein [Burkholderiales bacterium]
MTGAAAPAPRRDRRPASATVVVLRPHGRPSTRRLRWDRSDDSACGPPAWRSCWRPSRRRPPP